MPHVVCQRGTSCLKFLRSAAIIVRLSFPVDMSRSVAEALSATYDPSHGPLQIEVANVAADAAALPPGDGRDEHAMLYVDLRWRDALFRTTAQARHFRDGHPPAANALKFDTDRGVLSAAPPLTDDAERDALIISVRRCSLFGDSACRAVSAPIVTLPLSIGVEQAVRIGPFVLTMRPVNFGLPWSDATVAGTPANPIDVPSKQLAVLPLRRVPRPSQPAAVTADMEAPKPPPLAATPVPAVSAPSPPDAAEPLQIHKATDQLKPLTWTGAVPEDELVPQRPYHYRRHPRLQLLLSKGTAAGLPDADVDEAAAAAAAGTSRTLRSVMSAAAHAATGVVAAMVNTVELERMRVHFPDLRSPLVHVFKPSVLNGHGTPIPGQLYVTTSELAFHGPLLDVRAPYLAMAAVRRVACFGRECLQVLCADGTCYQIQDFEGTLERIGAAAGVHRVPSFVVAVEMIFDLFLLARRM